MKVVTGGPDDNPYSLSSFSALCLNGRIAYESDHLGGVRVGSTTPCPVNAKPTAIATIDNPWLFNPALGLLIVSGLLQLRLVRRDD
ncbi:MAG: hypothetical protein JWM87_703 [Candidatus Eremiobacteraeota bacterium]|nr:hypothetical protein [Candidatus Eremiobacteraeota bacterium]